MKQQVTRSSFIYSLRNTSFNQARAPWGDQSHTPTQLSRKAEPEGRSHKGYKNDSPLPTC